MKDCDDCGASSPDTAVTCSECGSLFPDQIGIELKRPISIPDFDERTAAQRISAPQRSQAVSVCRACGAKGAATQQRCTVCGSDQISLQLASAARTSRARRFLSAWDRRPKIGVLDNPTTDITTEFAYVYFSIGVFKLLLASLLAGILLFGRVGPGGLQYVSYTWRYPLTIILFADAFLAAFGGFAVLNAKAYGARLLVISFGLDLVLITWLVMNILIGRLVMWPDSGPYIFLGFVCLYCLVDCSRRIPRKG